MYRYNNRIVAVCLEGGCLTISSHQHNELIVTIESRDLLKAAIESGSLIIYYVIRTSEKTLNLKTILIEGPEDDILVLTGDILNTINGRPKRLLVVINPVSGKKKGIKIYEKYAVPLFKLCGVTADVIVTSKQKEPMDILRNYNISQIDGIVTVGGDGLYCECMNGLVTRVQRDNNIDFRKCDSNIVTASLPIGILPAGSGDVIVQYLHGTRCARTAVLHILLGNHVDSNIASVHEGGKLLSYSALVLGFGLFGDMMYDCEKFRWMGPSRYNVIPIKSMLKRRQFEVEVEYYSSKYNTVKRTRMVGRQISLPNGVLSAPRTSRKFRPKSTSDVSKHIETEECTKEKDRVYAVDTHPITLKERSGHMTPRFGQSSLMVYTTHKCTLSDHISQLTKVKQEQPDCYNYKFVSKHEVTRYKVKLLNARKDQSRTKDFYINCDGEVIRLKEASFDVKLHRKAVKFFGDVAD